MKYCRGGMTSLDYLIEIQRLENELKKYDWISVKDRLPEIPKPDEGYYCFLVTDGSLIHMAYYTEDGWLFADSGEMKEMFYEVTHWMSLPKMPKKPYQEWDRISKERRSEGSDAE